MRVDRRVGRVRCDNFDFNAHRYPEHRDQTRQVVMASTWLRLTARSASGLKRMRQANGGTVTPIPTSRRMLANAGSLGRLASFWTERGMRVLIHHLLVSFAPERLQRVY